MKIISNYLILFGILISLSTCSSMPTSTKQPLATQPVGPAPGRQTSVANHGYLIVYSAWDYVRGDSESKTIPHTAYKILSEQGQLIQRVQNYSPRALEVPDRVSLPAGSYNVVAHSNRSGKVDVPVIIKEGQTTFVFLDGATTSGTLWEHRTDAVKLPDGEIVGWPANVTQK